MTDPKRTFLPAGLYFQREEYEARWRRAIETIRRRGYETVIVWQRSAGGLDRVGNVFWLTNFVTIGTGQDFPDMDLGGDYSFSAVIFSGENEPELHIGQPLEETDVSRFFCGRLVAHQINLAAGIADRLTSAGIEGRVAVVGDDILPGIYDRLLRGLTPRIDWISEEDLLVEAQEVKSAREIEAYRTAGAIVSEALDAMMNCLVKGSSSAEAAARAAGYIVRAGGGYHRIDAIHGERSLRYPLSGTLHGYDGTAPANGEMVRAWIYGPIFQGYWLDPGRTAVCGGKPTAEQRALLEGALEIVSGIVAAIRPGVTARQLGVVGETLARKVGYHDHRQSIPLFGHGLGAYFAPPIIPIGDPGPDPAGRMRYDLPLKSGMVVSAEAVLRHEGVGMAGFEQNLIVTDNGVELLTATPLRYW